jgi:hypothetical protein
VFSLGVPARWIKVGGAEPPATHEVHPTAPWNYAIDPDDIVLVRQPVAENPFTNAPLQLHVKGSVVPDWTLEHGAAAMPPPSPVTLSGDIEALVLIPYGCTTLRVTELPTTNCAS